ncbi:hypothetical protein AMTRI_Chr04g179580 [Amborella trichopoda]
MEGPSAATWRACSCAHVLLDLPRFSFETERIKLALAIAFKKPHFHVLLTFEASQWLCRSLFFCFLHLVYILP